MGCFSWIYSDTQKPLRIGEPGILVLPQGGVLMEPVYRGYGMFAGQDVYELVAEWNRSYLVACEDQDNRRLPYPIKICRYRENAEYGKLMPSMGDLGQGL